MVLGAFSGIVKFDSSGNYGSALASGVDPNNVNRVKNSALVLMRRGALLKKARYSPQEILKAHSIAQQAEDENYLLDLQIAAQARDLQAGVQRLRLARKQVGNAQRAEIQWQGEMQAMQSDLLRYRMQTGIIQAESQGTQKAFKTSAIDSL